MPDAATPTIYCARIGGPDAAVRALLGRYPTEAKLRRRDHDSVTVEVYVDERVIAAARELGLAADVLYDATARSAERQQQVGGGNRFADGKRIPQGLGLVVQKPDPAQ